MKWKQRLALALCGLLLALGLCACVAQPGQGRTLEVYYRMADGGMSAGSAVGKESYPLSDTADALHEALWRLTEAPGGRFLPALPPEVRINAYSLADGEISLSLSPGYSRMAAVDRTLARCCLVLTLCGLSEVDRVSIYEEETLTESGLTPDILLAESAADSDYQTEITLWFPDAARNCLVSERRQLTVAQYRPLAECAVEELLSGDRSADRSTPLPEGTSLVSVKVSNGLCTVELSEEFYVNRPLTAREERLTVYALVNTMTELAGVERVQLKAGGSELARYTYLDLSQPLTRVEDFTDTAQAAQSWFPVSIYLGTVGGKLVPVPVGLENPNLELLPGQALSRLIELDGSWGYLPMFPAGTRLLDCTVKDRICTLELSPDFLTGDRQTLMQAARAMAATATDAGGVVGVRIRVGSAFYLSGEMIMKDSEWIVE